MPSYRSRFCAFASALTLGVLLAAPPLSGSAAAGCALVPVLRSVTINQGLGSYSPLVRGKETLVRLYLSLPSCAESTDQIQLTSAQLTVSSGATALTPPIASTPALVATYPLIAPFAAAALLDSPGDPKFVVPGSVLAAGTSGAAYTATFSATITFTPVVGAVPPGVTPSDGSATTAAFSVDPVTGLPISASVEQRTNALRVLVVPMGDARQTFSSQFSTDAQKAIQDGMLTLSRIFPVPDGIGDLTPTATGGVRYAFSAGLLDLSTLPLPYCGTGINFDTIKAQLGQFLQSYNTANPTAPADRVLGAVDEAISSGSIAGCADGMASVISPEAWVRALYSSTTATPPSPSMTGGLIAMEIAHTMGVVPSTRYDIYSPYHSPNLAADGTSPYRAYNVPQRSYLSENHTVMDFAGTWNNVNTLLEQADYAFIVCLLGGVQNTECGTATGTVGTATGVGANPTFVMSGTTDGTAAGTNVVESYMAAGVPRTTPDRGSVYRLIQRNSTAVVSDLGVPVSFANSVHSNSPPPALPAPATNTPIGLFSIAFPFNTLATTIEFWNGPPATTGAVLLYSRTQGAQPQITSISAPAAACSPNVAVFPTPTAGSTPLKITTGPDGNLWFTEAQADKIGKITPAGAITEYPIPRWSAVGGLNTGRAEHTASRLADGRVLVAGGESSTLLASAELYDPATAQWTPAGSMSTTRRFHTATLLGNGKVLVAGGLGAGNVALASAELFDPTTGSWTLTQSMSTGRTGHTATLLSSGKVMVAGGGPASSEIFDPGTLTWSVPVPMTAARRSHTAAILANGNVLVAGGFGSAATTLASAELFNPVAGTWSATSSMSSGRANHTATPLSGGAKILVAGGFTQPTPSGTVTTLASAELFDPGTASWTPAGSMSTARANHTATALNNGKVLVAGGQSLGALLPAAEVFDPVAGAWSLTDSMNDARAEHTATGLSNGTVLVTGGRGTTTFFLATAELFAPTSNPAGIVTGPNGNFWFTEQTADRIGQITPAGVITNRFPLKPLSLPVGITLGPDGNLWFTEAQANKIGKITTAGVITEFPIGMALSTPNDIVTGRDGNLWFTEDNVGKIGKITPTGAITEFAVPSGASSFPAYITAGPDGNLWFTEQNANKIGRISTAGSFTEFGIPTSESGPAGITSGPDGNLWFAERNTSKIGVITPSGVVTQYTSPSISQPFGITSGPDGNIWFTEFANAVGRLTPCAAPLPVTVTATASLPANLRLDCFFITSTGSALPLAVAVKPQSSTTTSSTFICPFDSSLAPAGSTVRAIVSDGFQQSPPQPLAVTPVAPKPPVATINSPLPKQTFLQYANIPLRGSAKSPQDGQLSGSALQTTTNILPGTPGGSGDRVDFSPPTGGWTPGSYTATLQATDSQGRVSTASVSITIVADKNDYGIPDAKQTPCPNGAAYPFGNAGDGKPFIDKQADNSDMCTLIAAYRALMITFPQTLFLQSTDQFLAAGLVVPYRDASEINGSTVRIVKVAGKDVSSNLLFTNPNNLGWAVLPIPPDILAQLRAQLPGMANTSVFGGVLFDQQKIIQYLQSQGIVNQTVTITVAGQSQATPSTGRPVFTFEGSASIFVAQGSPPAPD